MSVLVELACMQNRRDEAPNEDLAGRLVEEKDAEGIKEVVENLWNKDKNIQSDCVSVLEHIGLLDPGLIEGYVCDFVELLSSKNNRLVWGAMIALGVVSDRKPKEVFGDLDNVVETINGGSVITRDNGIKTLAGVASVNEAHSKVIFPLLIEYLRECRPKSVPQYAESILRAVTPANQEQYLDVLNQRFDTLSVSQQKRTKKLLRTFDDRG